MDKRDFSKIKTLVVKLGTSIMTGKSGHFSEAVLEKLIHQILKATCSRNIQLVIVTSGAIGLGMETLRLKKRPKDLAALQACAAVGQGKLIGLYDAAFSKVGLHTAQILLTREEFEERKLYVNVRRTLLELLKRGIVPVINENDTVATQEIQFGDNDTLSALVACSIQADLAVILSDVEGFFLKDKTLLSYVEGIDQVEALHSHLFTRKREHTVGGMTTKLRAAKMLIHSGLNLLIADGRDENVLEKILRGESVGTLFAGSGKHIASRKSWLAHSARLAGEIVVDKGAEEAVITKGKSLLARGATEVRGSFERGEIVRVLGAEGHTIGTGKTNYSSDELVKILGKKTSEIPQILGYVHKDEVIHHNEWVSLRSKKGKA